jgi:hypothetical protein
VGPVIDPEGLTQAATSDKLPPRSKFPFTSTPQSLAVTRELPKVWRFSRTRPHRNLLAQRPAITGRSVEFHDCYCVITMDDWLCIFIVWELINGIFNGNAYVTFTVTIFPG